MSEITVLKKCELCTKYTNCKIYEKVCKELTFLKNFLDLKFSNEIAKYCKEYNQFSNKELKEIEDWIEKE